MKEPTNTQPNFGLKFHTRQRLEKLVKNTWIKYHDMAPKLVPCRNKVYFETFSNFFLFGLGLVTLNHFSLVPKNVSMVESLNILFDLYEPYFIPQRS
jgi:hypothetical protein